MCPDTYDFPSICLQPCVGVPIALLIRDDFSAPEFGVLLGPSSVQRATVPKAPIDEYGDVRAYERDIGDSARAGDEGNVDSITETESA